MDQPTPKTIDPEAGAAALAKLLKGESNLKVTLTPAEVCVLISHVQLALRHPENTGPSSQIAEGVIRNWIKKLPVAAQPYMEAGFDPAMDL